MAVPVERVVFPVVVKPAEVLTVPMVNGASPGTVAVSSRKLTAPVLPARVVMALPVLVRVYEPKPSNSNPEAVTAAVWVTTPPELRERLFAPTEKAPAITRSLSSVREALPEIVLALYWDTAVFNRWVAPIAPEVKVIPPVIPPIVISVVLEADPFTVPVPKVNVRVLLSAKVSVVVAGKLNVVAPEVFCRVRL